VNAVANARFHMLVVPCSRLVPVCPSRQAWSKARALNSPLGHLVLIRATEDAAAGVACEVLRGASLDMHADWAWLGARTLDDGSG
jgi:hypothetical protein